MTVSPIRWKALSAAVCLMLLCGTGCAACTERVPAAHVGVVEDPSGLREQVLHTGYHDCWGRSRLILMEAGETTVSESYKILCADGLNIDFRVNVTFSVDQAKEDKILDMFKRIKPAGHLGDVAPEGEDDKGSKGNGTAVITLQQLWTTYLKPVVGPRTREAVRPLESPRVPANASTLQQKLTDTIRTAVEDTGLHIRQVTIDNIDLDPSVTERNKARIAIEMKRREETEQQELEMLKTQNELIRANKDYEVELIRAQAVADSQRIINGSITPGYLQYHYTEMLRQVAQSDHGTSFMVIPGTAADIKIEAGQSAVDAELLSRVQEIRDRVTHLQEEHEKRMREQKEAQENTQQPQQTAPGNEGGIAAGSEGGK